MVVAQRVATLSQKRPYMLCEIHEQDSRKNKWWRFLNYPHNNYFPTFQLRTSLGLEFHIFHRKRIVKNCEYFPYENQVKSSCHTCKMRPVCSMSCLVCSTGNLYMTFNFILWKIREDRHFIGQIYIFPMSSQTEYSY